MNYVIHYGNYNKKTDLLFKYLNEQWQTIPHTSKSVRLKQYLTDNSGVHFLLLNDLSIQSEEILAESVFTNEIIGKQLHYTLGNVRG